MTVGFVGLHFQIVLLKLLDLGRRVISDGTQRTVDDAMTSVVLCRISEDGKLEKHFMIRAFETLFT